MTTSTTIIRDQPGRQHQQEEIHDQPRVVMGLKWYSTTRSSIPSLLQGTWKRTPQPIFQPKSSFAPLSMVRATRPILAPCGFGNVCLLLGEEGCGIDLDFSQSPGVCNLGGFMLGMFTSNPLGDSQAISSLSPVLFGASVQSESSDL